MTERTRSAGLQYEHCPDCGAHTWVLAFLRWGLGVLGVVLVAVVIPLSLKINSALGEVHSALRVNSAQVDDVRKKVDRIDEALVRHLTERR